MAPPRTPKKPAEQGPRRLLVATTNAGKVREIRALLDGAGWDVVSPDDIGLRLRVEETGDTYEANARLKAEAYARKSRLLTLADDSGIEVDALHGAPGVQSARYGGDVSEREQVTLLLRALEGVPDARRTARFVAVVVLATPEGEARSFRGVIEGRIRQAPAGENGFGYDPVFVPEGETRTTAQMAPEEKNRISHRARAVLAARAALERPGGDTFAGSRPAD